MKTARTVVSIIIFTLLTLYFLDFADLLPYGFHVLAHLQFIPALIGLFTPVLVLLVLLTLIFGRIYCSSICPLGILQDIAAWLSKKKHRKKKYTYLKDRKLLRWSIVALTVVAWLAGFSLVVSLLDPYSAYGRIATALFKPVYLALNNLVAQIGHYFHYERFYKVGIFMPGLAMLGIAVLTFLVVLFLAWKYGRLYCNSICPVGTVLGLLSRFSLLKIKIDESKCNGCGLCAMKCKGSCIDAGQKKIDYSRCVTCFNCLGHCNRDAMSYAFKGVSKPAGDTAVENVKYNPSRRKILSATILLGVAGIQKLFGRQPDSTIKKMDEVYTSHNVPFKRKQPVTPPGALNVNRFNDRCTACNLCVAKCPSNVLAATFTEYGLAGMLQPAMKFEHGYCNIHCTVCTEVCPAGALHPITEQEKKTLQLGQVQYIKENCIVETDGTDCGACSEHCPTQAVSMQPYKGDLRIPVIDAELCIGCGACEFICPVRPYRAIYVDGNPVHKQAKVPVEQKQEKIELNDFGF